MGNNNYSYNTDTSDEDVKYGVNIFHNMDTRSRHDHILDLWKKCFIRAGTFYSIRSSYNMLKTKIDYFGRQLIGDKGFRDLQDRRAERRTKSISIGEQSKSIILWKQWIILLLLYILLLMPFLIAFEYKHSLLYYFDIITDITFILDVFLSFFIQFKRTNGSNETQFKKIVKNYMLTNF